MFFGPKYFFFSAVIEQIMGGASFELIMSYFFQLNMTTVCSFNVEYLQMHTTENTTVAHKIDGQNITSTNCFQGNHQKNTRDCVNEVCCWNIG